MWTHGWLSSMFTHSNNNNNNNHKHNIIIMIKKTQTKQLKNQNHPPCPTLRPEVASATPGQFGFVGLTESQTEPAGSDPCEC